MDKLSSFQEEEKITIFVSTVQGSAMKKMKKSLGIRFFTLLICENNYETAVTYMNPRLQLRVRCRQLLIS